MSSPVYVVAADDRIIYPRTGEQVVVEVDDPYRSRRSRKSGYVRRTNSIPRSSSAKDHEMVNTSVLQGGRGQRSASVWVKPGYKGRKKATRDSSPKRSGSVDRSSRYRHGSSERKEKRSQSLGKAALEQYLSQGDVKLKVGGKELSLSVREVESSKRKSSPRRRQSVTSEASVSAQSDGSEESQKSDDGDDDDDKHKPLYVLVIVFTFIFLAVAIFLNLASVSPFGVEIGLFNGVQQGALAETLGDAPYDPLDTQFTPSGGTFSLWLISYLLLTALAAYALSTICRRGKEGYLYEYPVLSLCFYLFFNLNLVLNVSWLFVFDVLQIIWATVILWFMAATIYVATGLYSVTLRRVRRRLIDEGKLWDFRFLQFVGHNGLGIYAGWQSAAMCVQLNVALIYGPAKIPDDTASSVCFSIIGVLLVTYAVVDLVALDQYTRYLVGPYISVMGAAAGIIDKNWSSTFSSANKGLAATLLVAVLAILVLKVVFMILRHRSKPYFPGKTVLKGPLAKKLSSKKRSKK